MVKVASSLPPETVITSPTSYPPPKSAMLIKSITPELSVTVTFNPEPEPPVVSPVAGVVL